MKTILLLFFSVSSLLVSASENPLKNSINNEASIFRGVEIRYIVNHPENELFLILDEKKYPVFNSKKEAISYVENMTIKYDITVVYVRSTVEKETEFTDIIE